MRSVVNVNGGSARWASAFQRVVARAQALSPFCLRSGISTEVTMIALITARFRRLRPADAITCCCFASLAAAFIAAAVIIYTDNGATIAHVADTITALQGWGDGAWLAIAAATAVTPTLIATSLTAVTWEILRRGR